jgi:hypothetical protein
MDPLTISILTSLATGYFVNFTSASVVNFFKKAILLEPSLEEQIQKARTPEDFEKVFEDAVGVIDAAAGSGIIDVHDAFLEALRGIRFDHQNGTVTIQGSRLQAPIMQTGGTGTGKTTIGGNTSLKSHGTEISIGNGASIIISGNANIRQS